MKNVCHKNGIRWGHFVGLGAWLAIGCLLMGHASAATMAYYRFEGSTAGGSSAPWVSDSSGNGYTLVGSFGTISQVSSVLNPIPVNSLSNSSAASFNGSNFYTNPVSGVLSQMSSFTIEAFVKWQGPNSAGTTGVIAGQWDTTGSLYSYFFGVDNTGHLTLGVNSGGPSNTYSSSQTLTAGVNYYLAATFDPTDSTAGVKFYLLDLSSDQNNLQLQVMANTLTALRPPTARLVIGCTAFSGSNSYFNGTLDEVRISNVPLDRSGLLISGPSFREFSGVNGSSTSNSLFGQALSYNRSDFFWGNVEPTQGNWQQSVLTSLGSQVLAYHAENVNYLPIFDYMNAWAADMNPRQWSSTDGTIMNTLVPSGSNMLLSTYTLQTNGSYSLTSTYTTNAADISHFPPASMATWTNYVSKTTTFLAAPPYNVRYFQIWNEAYYTSGFWMGSMADYFNRIHIPAAAAIHAAGGKVVYGGWPDVAPITELISDLDAYNAWSSIDVLDFHYLAPSTYATLRAAADSRGYTNLAIWQSETGYTSYVQFVLDSYSRLLYWGLSNHWTSTDMYKALYYTNASSTSTSDPAYGNTFYTGSTLAGQGQLIQTLGSLLNGAGTQQYPGLTTSPALSNTLDVTASSMQAFRIGVHKIAVVMELNTATYNGYTNITLTIPVAKTAISKAVRIDLTGIPTDITSQLVAAGSSTTLPVAVKDPAGTTSRSWNDATYSSRGVLVQLTLY